MPLRPYRAPRLFQHHQRHQPLPLRRLHHRFMNLTSFGLSDIGVSRANNEDVWVALPDLGFFALADGMGGHKAGEVAAKEAIENLIASIRRLSPLPPLDL